VRGPLLPLPGDSRTARQPVTEYQRIRAGAAGFVAGAVLIGSGLIAIARLLRTDVADLPAE
jgi:hypothetical protein